MATPPRFLGDPSPPPGRAGYDFLEISIDDTDKPRAVMDRRRRWENLSPPRGRKPAVRTGAERHRKSAGQPGPGRPGPGLEIFEKAVRFADAAGIRIIQLAGYDVYYEEGGPDTRTMFLENLEKGVAFAARYGVLTGFETMETPFMDTVEKAMAAVRAVDSPYLGEYPDSGTLQRLGKSYGTNCTGTFSPGRPSGGDALRKRRRVYRDLDFGEGHVDFPRGAKAALDQGVGLFVTELWHDGREDWPSRLSGVCAFARSALSQTQ
jgi:L-ribulose-5-phosphate 3-epimerase UlaE